MITMPNKIYAIILHNKLHCKFTKDELPEYNENNITVVDVTNTDCQIGDFYQNGVFVNSIKTLDELKVDSVNSISNYAELVRQKIAGNPTALKASAWSSKEARARRIISETATPEDIALVQAEANQRGKGETALQLAEKQLAKASSLLQAVSVIDGMESRAIDAVMSAPDQSAINALMDALKVEAESAITQLLGA